MILLTCITEKEGVTAVQFFCQIQQNTGLEEDRPTERQFGWNMVSRPPRLHLGLIWVSAKFLTWDGNIVGLPPPAVELYVGRKLRLRVFTDRDLSHF